MGSKAKDDRLRPKRQEMALAATDRAAREIIRSEAEARKDLKTRLKASRIEKEADEQSDKH
ncbi:hypothetical protein P6F26_09850 [Roseibacterium sp. SDUM158017]|uniref:hypothetical protein n=1 Tax=Roseicyclus salinarum TaxID=3036773 RepID=UPI00241555F0|nr:hypothetical protein [Roseibacterium sp. SDUM158017]MDG4648747.1 hypothetical protein [Roseibacterium sp. SDUM158017]